MKSAPHSLKRRAISILAAVTLPFAAQAGETLPTPKKTVAPQLSDAIRDEAGEVRIRVAINQHGFVTDAQIDSSTNERLNAATMEAVRQWAFNPAEANGTPVASKAIQPFYFNRGAIVLEEKKSPRDTHPSVKSSAKPKLPDDLRSITGEVVLLASVDADGSVQGVEIMSSSHRELEASAAAALARWRFNPAIRSGGKVASKVLIPFSFEGEGARGVVAKASRSPQPDRAPVALRQPTPDLPRELRNERGEVRLRLTVDTHGYVADVETIESSSDALSAAAREAAFQWKFKPATRAGLPVAAKVVQPFSFNGGIIMADVPVDAMPVVRRSKTPALPEALEGVQGFVNVRLTLDAQGKVVSASSAKSSHEELVAPTLEAAKSWTFKPAMRDGRSVPSSVIVPFLFNERG